VSRRGRKGPAGIILLDKESGPTSFQLVQRVRRLTGIAKVGHAGTLDPMASGLLVVGVGPATRLLRFLSEGGKSYRGVVRFTGSTDTDDATGTFLDRGHADFSDDELRRALDQFTGEIEQLPPRVSAVKVQGKRAYALVRDHGENPELKPRRVVIEEISLLRREGDEAEIRVRCGGGTYIRALARDLGERLGCPAHLASLRRETVGPFTLSRALGWKEFEQSYRRDGDAVLLPPLSAVEGWPRLPLSATRLETVRHGGQPSMDWWEGGAWPEDAPRAALVDEDGALAALAERGPAGPRLLMVLTE